MHTTKYLWLMMLVLSVVLVLTGCSITKNTSADKDTTPVSFTP